jgi:predicted homoserine dehydrogenase-like protein
MDSKHVKAWQGEKTRAKGQMRRKNLSNTFGTGYIHLRPFHVLKLETTTTCKVAPLRN